MNGTGDVGTSTITLEALLAMKKLGTMICALAVLGLCAGPASAIVVNVARQGTASQSTLGSGGMPERAIDGGMDGNWGYGSVSHTDGGTAGNWWQVDLGTTMPIQGMDVSNRYDCCWGRLSNFRVSVLDGSGGEVHGQDFAGPVGRGATQAFSFPQGTEGQVVKVQLNGPNAEGNHTLALAEVRVYGDTAPPNGTNMAQDYGTATASSIDWGGVPWRAIDGNTNGSFGAGSVSHTGAELSPSWRVDLGGEAHLDHITIHERTDGCCNALLKDFTVSVLDQTMATVYSQSVADVNGHVNLALPYGTEGRHVRVQMNDSGTTRTLQLAEVQAIGGASPNLARNPRAAASQSTTAAGGVPERAIDGNTNGSWGAGSVTHTDGTTANNWWQVELGSDMPIEDVVLYNRSDCCGERLSNFRLSVFDGGEEVHGQNLFVGSGSVPQGGDLRVPIPEGTVGDRVRVQLLGKNNDGGGQVSLAEAQVWGQEQERSIGVHYTDVVAADGPVAYWRMGESSAASAAADQMGTRDGTYTGGVTVGEPGAIAGDTDTAARLDGSSGHVAIGTSPALNSAGQITYEAWVQPQASSGFQNILAHGHQFGPDAEGFLRMNGSTYQVGRYPNEVRADAPGAADVGSGEWVHLAGVYNGTRWELFRNGLRVGASAPTPYGAIAFAPDNVGWAIGARGTGTERFFNGLIDEVALYDQALTPDQISRHYQLGSREAPPAFSSEDSTRVGDRLEKNIALGGGALQSSTHSAGPAANAIDGNLGNFSHTADADDAASLEVDLGGTFQLETLMLHNRDSCCHGRLRDVTVEVLGSDGSVAYTSPLLNPGNAMGGPEFIPVDLKGLTGGAVEGRFVRISRTSDGSGGSDGNALSLGEVQVYSSFAITGDTAPGGIDKTGLLYHLDAGKGVVTTGGNVATWTDQSGSNNDFVQAAVNKQPELVANALNGQAVIRFDGDNASNALADELVLGTSTTPRTVIILNNTTDYRGFDGIWGRENGDLGIREYPSEEWRYPGDGGDFASPTYSVMFVDGVVTNAFTIGEPHMVGALRATSPATFSATSLGQYFGDGHGAGVRAWGGDIGEVIVYDRLLNMAELAMVGNYLSAKYAVPIGPADLYRGDEPAQGNYDRDVFGIGQVDADNKVTAAGSAGLGLMVENGSLGDGDFLLAGHGQASNSFVDTNLGGFAVERWERAWYIDETGDMDAVLTFDFGDAGLPFLGLPLDSQYQFALLYADELGADFEVLDYGHWTLNGDQVSFALSGMVLNDGYYTLGTAFVPEPATLSLLGLGALALLRRRRRH